jgi:hypothetical protein
MQDTLTEIKRNLLGPLSIGYYVSAFIMCGIALLVMASYRSRHRDKDSPHTPVHYSFQFMIWDNTKRIGAGLLVMYILFRFASEWLHTELSMQLALGFGFLLSMGLDPIIEALMNRYDWICKALSQPREKFMDKLAEKQKDQTDTEPNKP